MKPSRDRRGPENQDKEPQDAAIDENEIDQVLADSFPASDPPPWTLGVTSGRAKDIQNRKKERR